MSNHQSSKTIKVHIHIVYKLINLTLSPEAFFSLKHSTMSGVSPYTFVYKRAVYSRKIAIQSELDNTNLQAHE